MSAVTVAQFRTRHPEFLVATFPDDRVQFYLDDLEKDFDLEVWGEFFERGICYLTAHKLVFENVSLSQAPGSVTGLAPISSRAIGDVSTGFAAYLTMTAEADVYNLSSYGRWYWDLRKTLAIGAVAVTW